VIGLRLDVVVGADASVGRDAVDADEHDVQVDVGQRPVGDRADQLVGLGPDAAAADD
jgi:hypothetical protein